MEYHDEHFWNHVNKVRPEVWKDEVGVSSLAGRTPDMQRTRLFVKLNAWTIRLRN